MADIDLLTPPDFSKTFQIPGLFSPLGRKRTVPQPSEAESPKPTYRGPDQAPPVSRGIMRGGRIPGPVYESPVSGRIVRGEWKGGTQDLRELATEVQRGLIFPERLPPRIRSQYETFIGTIRGGGKAADAAAGNIPELQLLNPETQDLLASESPQAARILGYKPAKTPAKTLPEAVVKTAKGQAGGAAGMAAEGFGEAARGTGALLETIGRGVSYVPGVDRLSRALGGRGFEEAGADFPQWAEQVAAPKERYAAERTHPALNFLAGLAGGALPAVTAGGALAEGLTGIPAVGGALSRVAPTLSGARPAATLLERATVPMTRAALANLGFAGLSGARTPQELAEATAGGAALGLGGAGVGAGLGAIARRLGRAPIEPVGVRTPKERAELIRDVEQFRMKGATEPPAAAEPTTLTEPAPPASIEQEAGAASPVVFPRRAYNPGDTVFLRREAAHTYRPLRVIESLKGRIRVMDDATGKIIEGDEASFIHSGSTLGRRLETQAERFRMKGAAAPIRTPNEQAEMDDLIRRYEEGGGLPSSELTGLGKKAEAAAPLSEAAKKRAERFRMKGAAVPTPVAAPPEGASAGPPVAEAPSTAAAPAAPAPSDTEQAIYGRKLAKGPQGGDFTVEQRGDWWVALNPEGNVIGQSMRQETAQAMADKASRAAAPREGGSRGRLSTPAREEGGFTTPAVATRIGGALVGGLYGSAKGEDNEDKFKRMLIYGGVGLAAAYAMTGGGRIFAQRDIIPAGRAALTGFGDLLRTGVHYVSPRFGVSREALDMIGDYKGDLQQWADRFRMQQTGIMLPAPKNLVKRAVEAIGLWRWPDLLNATTENIKDFFWRLPETDRIAFIDRIKTGQRQATPELQEIADFMRQVDTNTWTDVHAYNPSLAWLDDHFRVFWKTIPGAPQQRGFLGLFRRPLAGTQGFFRQHTLPDISTGIAAGGVPTSTNPMELFHWAQEDMNRYLAAQRMWDTMGNAGTRQFVRTGKNAPPGFVRLDDPIARKFFRVPQGLVHPGDWWVEEGAGRLLNNFLMADPLRTGPGGLIGRPLLWMRNMWTQFELALNGFHAVFSGKTAVTSRVGLGLTKLSGGDIRGGIGDIVSAPGSAITTAQLGGKVIKLIRNQQEFAASPEGQAFLREFPNIGDLIDDLFRGGGQLNLHGNYKNQAVNTFKSAVSAGNYPGALIRAMPAATEWMMKPLFETYIPRLKLGTFLREYSNELSRATDDIIAGRQTRPQIARRVWDSIDDRFGLMNFDNLFWNKAFKSALQIMFRSPTWKAGTWRSFGTAVPDQIGGIMRDIEAGRVPRVEPKLAWIIAEAGGTAAMGAATMYALTEKWPSAAVDYFFPQIDKDDPTIRLSLPTYMKDFYSATHNVAAYVKHGMTGFIGKAADLWNNKDYFGTEIYPEEGTAGEKVAAIAKHMVPAPFSVTSLMRMREEGEPIGKQLMTMGGFTRAPSYVSQPAEIQALRDVQASRQEMRAKTAAEFAKRQLVNKWTRDLRRAARDPQQYRSALQGLDASVDREELTSHERDRIMDNLQFGDFIAGVKRLTNITPEELERLYRVVSPENRRPLQDEILRVLHNWDESDDPAKRQRAWAARQRFRQGSR